VKSVKKRVVVYESELEEKEEGLVVGGCAGVSSQSEVV